MDLISVVLRVALLLLAVGLVIVAIRRGWLREWFAGAPGDDAAIERARAHGHNTDHLHGDAGGGSH